MGCESDLQALANFFVPQQHLGWNITTGAHYQTPNGTKNLFILHCLCPFPVVQQHSTTALFYLK